MKNNMTISTPRLTLRSVCLKDLEARHAYSSDPENTRFMMFLPNESIEETEAFIRESMAEMAKPEPNCYEFTIFLDGAQIGGIDIEMHGEGQGTLGWILDKRYWGNGYAQEAARGLMDWARENLGVRRFIAYCDSENAASYRLMERLGMRRTACDGGRKNRSSDEERMELTYEVEV